MWNRCYKKIGQRKFLEEIDECFRLKFFTTLISNIKKTNPTQILHETEYLLQCLLTIDLILPYCPIKIQIQNTSTNTNMNTNTDTKKGANNRSMCGVVLTINCHSLPLHLLLLFLFRTLKNIITIVQM